MEKTLHDCRLGLVIPQNEVDDLHEFCRRVRRETGMNVSKSEIIRAAIRSFIASRSPVGQVQDKAA